MLALALVALAPQIEQREWGQRLALSYGAAILSFVGAVHWGLSVAGRWRWTLVGIGGAIAPAVVATIGAVVGGARGIGVLVIGFGLFWLYEHRQRGADLPADYLALRRNLTLLVCGLLVLTMWVSERAGLA